jgi:hypothetical protein
MLADTPKIALDNEADTTTATDPNGVARLPRRKLPRDTSRDDNEGSIKPWLARHGHVRFLTLAHLDGRSRAVASANALKAGFETDLGGDLSTGQSQLVQRAALLGVMIEDFETRHLLGEPIEVDLYLTAINVQRRVLVTLGLERKARDVSTPSLNDYLASQAADMEPAPVSDEDLAVDTVDKMEGAS